MEAKVIKGHVWLDVTEKSRDLYGILELYVLYQDGTESLIESFIGLLDSLKDGHIIAVDTGTNITPNTVWVDRPPHTMLNVFSNCTSMPTTW